MFLRLIRLAGVGRVGTEILQAGQRGLATEYPGSRFEYGFTGSSGSGVRELAEAASFGVVKVNVDTDDQYAFTRGLAGHVPDRWQGVLKVDDGIRDKPSFDRRAWGAPARQRWPSASGRPASKSDPPDATSQARRPAGAD